MEEGGARPNLSLRSQRLVLCFLLRVGKFLEMFNPKGQEKTVGNLFLLSGFSRQNLEKIVFFVPCGLFLRVSE